jgi:hypothetical protein
MSDNDWYKCKSQLVDASGVKPSSADPGNGPTCGALDQR